MPLIMLILFITLFIWAVITPGSLDRAISASVEQNSPEPMLVELKKKPVDVIGIFFHKMIAVLWDSNQRELAAEFVHQFVLIYPQVGRGHSWVSTILKQEPEIAKRSFINDFLSESYNPNAKCGFG
jgi:hypothetical protein